ncbi:stemmadenine O-acetyltransferase-like [Salvia hispanica]|uniref:stemmadenine O-acetyltransferase-like n=1 Tax=Salvia hispanica TaxID=49212 RepID=UPI0020091727|nr:stemmadenine O-acetyltransferase-like [Salvia hispanica]
MDIESRVISIETLTPSTPTPKYQQKYQLSFLDQGIHPSFSPFVYFYSSKSNPKFSNSDKSNLIKKSLSDVLSIYYPLAGRIVGNLYVDCNDAGIPFSEAEADCDLSHSQVIANQNPKNLKKFYLLKRMIPKNFAWRNSGGGVSLPKFDTATYVPPLDILINLQLTSGLVEEDNAARVFVFSASEISALQERYTAGGHRPSRVEALSAFTWGLYIGIRSDPGKICVVHNAVNLRNRADPPLSQYQFGNLVVSSRLEAAAGVGGAELIWKVREALKAVDAGYVGRLKKREMQLKLIKAGAGKSMVDRFFFSSLCKFPLYEADFGWGRPDRVMFGGFPYKNLATFMDTRCGGGIETLIQLTKQDMDKLEAHFLLRSYL